MAAFQLDRFQVEAIDAVERGESVLVAAPTGSGKTEIALAAIRRAVANGHRAFYTAPIKALSNQKFEEFRREWGADSVGLLTGDHAVNSHAPVVVMTTEVLRNMLYRSAGEARLADVGVVVLDEVHFLQDAYRGPVWEEVLIHTEPAVQFVCLSATVSNSSELGDWIATLRGPTTVVVETRRPIELTSEFMVRDRRERRIVSLPVVRDGVANPEGRRFDFDPAAGTGRGDGKSRRRPFATPRRSEVVECLDDRDLLPAIYFIFGRAACDEAMETLRDSGVRLTTAAEVKEVKRLAERHIAGIDSSDRRSLGVDGWLDALSCGIAAHHAGMVPAMREAVEACFVAGLVKVVFATETLALGINMPARSVVIEKLTKFNGDGFEMLTPAQFTQLTGRAGRRGMDEAGTAVVLWSPFVGFDQVAALAMSDRFELRSAFRPTYNMAANLVRRYQRADARDILERSFAQFQADRSLVEVAAQATRAEREIERLAAVAHEGPGDIAEYASLAAKSRRRGNRATEAVVASSLRSLRPGDVVAVRSEAVMRWAVVVSIAERARRGVRVRVVLDAGESRFLEPAGLGAPVRPIGRLDLPQPYAPSDQRWRDDAAETLAQAIRSELPAIRELPSTEDPIARHDVHRDPRRAERLAAWKELTALQRKVERVRRSHERTATSVAATFDRVIDVLTARGHVKGWALTASGELLSRVYHERDLIVVEAVTAGCLDDLSVPELAAVVSGLCFEPRGEPDLLEPPSLLCAERFAAMTSLAAELGRVERAHGLPLTKPPDFSFAGVAFAWADGTALGELIDGERSAGDIVRHVRRVADIADQLGRIALDGGPISAVTGAVCRAAATTMVRGIVVSEPVGVDRS